MSKPIHYLTKTETEIMKYLWQLDREATAREIRDHFSAEKKWSKQAISTFLKHLVEHKFLTIRKESITKYYYSVAITEKEYQLLPAKDIIHNTFLGSYGDFVCALIDPKEKLSEESIKKINDLINSLIDTPNNESDTK